MFTLHRGNVSYQIKKEFIHIYARDEFYNNVELVTTKNQIEIIYKLITKK